MINAERVGSGVECRDAFINTERMRSAEAGHLQSENAGASEIREVGCINFLVGSWRKGIAFVSAQLKLAFKYDGVPRVKDAETVSGGDVEFAQGAEILTNHGDLWEVRHVTALIHMNRGTEPVRFHARFESCVGDAPKG